MVREDMSWKFQQLQFQFDLNNLLVLYATILLAILLLASLIRLVFVIIRSSRK